MLCNQKLRRDRSAVEPLRFLLKDSFDFGLLQRRGLEAVRTEQLGLPSTTRKDERLGHLRKVHGFRSSEIRQIVKTHKK